MKRHVIALALAPLLVAACSSGGGSKSSSSSSGGDGGGGSSGGEASSPFTPAPPAGSEAIPVEANSYNYSPAVMDEGDVIKAWWCSSRPDAATDQIFYQEYDKKTKEYRNRRSVLQTGKPGDWDTFGVCHPSVIKGSWPGAPGGGTFSYALYYTSTNVAQGGGSNNSTGVIFSTDGINWVGQHDPRNPNIKQKVPNIPGTYGAGLPAAWSNGGSSVTLFWTDTTAERRPAASARSAEGYGSRGVFATAADGIHFDTPKLVSQNGAPAYWKNDFAFDDSASPAMVYAAQALQFRAGTGAQDKNETYNFGIFRVNKADLLAGVGGWEQLGVVDTNLTGLPLNFEPGLVRTPNGGIAGDPKKDGITVWFGGGGQTPFTWQLHKVTLQLGKATTPLRRYTGAAAGSSWTTTGYVPASFRSGKATTLGVVDLNPGAGLVPLYSCMSGALTAGTDGLLTGEGGTQFVSLEQCPGGHILGVNGYVSPQAPAGGGKPLYACKDGTSSFVSNDAACEGKTVERQLGYAKSG